MLVPTIHLNGSSGERLLEQYAAAADAVRKAIDMLCDVDFNARDYYVQGSEVPQAAQREHLARIASLKQVREDLFKIVEGIQNQLDLRDAARKPR